MPAQDHLHVSHIALLKTIIDNPDSRRNELWIPRGKGLWNSYLRSSGLIRSGHCTLVKGLFRFTDAISTLHLCGYLRTDTEHYRASDVGITLFYSLDSHPCRWPLSVALDENGKRLWDRAVFFEKI